MPLTRAERQTLEKLIRKVGKLDSRIHALEKLTELLRKQVVGSGVGASIGNLTLEELEDMIGDAVTGIIRRKLPIHDHTTNLKGGDCFAKKGANLIE